MPKAYCSRCKSMIVSTVAQFEAERDHGELVLPLSSVRERASTTLGVSLATVSKISSEVKKGNVLVSPKRKRDKGKPVVDVDNFAECAIRNAVYDMHRNKQNITLKSLGIVLRERDIFTGGQISLWKVLQNIGFYYKKDDPKRALMEIPHIALKRVNFLSEYSRIKQSGDYQFVFTDETWIFQDGTVARSWQDEDVRSVRKSKIGGKRFIVLHAGNSDGFIDGADLAFPSASTSGDYHGEMNRTNYLRWFEHQLLRHLERPSAIVLDNASYHNTILNKPPTAASTKAAIQQWLTENNIEYDKSLLKIQLLQLVDKNKPCAVYEVDQLAQQYGHMILRLPPYHCIFNPIEHIWGITKSYYARYIGEHGRCIESVQQTWQNSLKSVTPETWRKTIQHTENEIYKWWEREVAVDRENPGEFIINVNMDSSSEDELSD